MRWEARRVPFEDRSPVAVKTLEIIAAQGSAVTLEQLDQMPLVALVSVDDKEKQELQGLVWIAPLGQEAVIPLYWFRTWDGAEAVVEEVRDLLAELNVEAVSMATHSKDEREVAKALGFKMLPRRYWRMEV